MPQSLSSIVKVTVQVSPVPPGAPTFNTGIIVGTSTVINNVTRTVSYSSTSDMTSNGWAGTEPEYLAAQVYFDQSPAPSSVVIGRQGSASTTLSASLASGTAYTTLSVAALTGNLASGDTLTIGSGATTQTVTTSAAAVAGATTIDVVSFTANAAYASGVAVSNAETAVQAVTACRASNTDFYGSYVCGAADSDIEAVAQYIETATPTSTYFYDTQDTAVLNGTVGNVMETLQAAKYTATIGIYSTTSYAGAGLLGEAMGLNTGLSGSAFTLAYKSLTGITPELLTSTQVSTILGYNGNVYTQYGASYDLLVQGTMADGTPYDQKLNIDQLSADITTAVVDALTTTPKVPQTDAGVSILVNDISAVCAQAVTKGVLAPGIWTAAPVLLSNGLGLQTGQNLPMGFLVLADTIASQSAADRAARKAPPIYVCAKMAGAIEHAVIGVVVNY